jgi:hypothetical protein
MDLLLVVIRYVVVYSHLAIQREILHRYTQSTPVGKAAKEGAFVNSVEWFNKYMK